MASSAFWMLLLGVVITFSYVHADGMPLQCYKCESAILLDTGTVAPGLQYDEDCDRGALTSVAVLNSGCCGDDQACGAAKADAKLNGMGVRLTVRKCFAKHTADCASEAEALTALMAAFPAATDITGAELCFCDSNFCSPVKCPGPYVKTFKYCLHYGIIIALVLGLLIALAMVTGCFFCCCCGCKCCKTKVV